MSDEFKVIVGGCKPDKEGRPQFIFDDGDDRDLEIKINGMIEKGWDPYHFALPTAYIQDTLGHARASVILVFRRASRDSHHKTPGT